MTLSDRVKDATSLRELAEASGVAWDARLSAPRRGDYWAKCPFHQDATPSLHVLEPAGVRGFFKCFGCDARGTVVDWVMLRLGVDAAEAIRRLAQEAGVAAGDPADRRDPARDAAALAAQRERERRAEQDAARGLARAAEIWRAATPGAALLRDYLSARGVDLSALSALWPGTGGVPPSLRLHARLGYFEPGAKRPSHEGPAMIAWVGRPPAFVGVHRTWITATGRARFADGRKVPKKMRGLTGGMFGAPIAFSPSRRAVVVGEGIETTLAAWAALIGRDGPSWGAEAAVSLGALTGAERPDGAPGWFPDAEAGEVLILAEGKPGDPAKAEAAARRAVAKLEARGLRARLAPPPGGWSDGRDMADLAAAEARP